MVEHVKDLVDLYPGIGATIRISDEQVDEKGRTVKEPVLVIAGGGGEMLGYIPISEFRKWFDPKAPSEITKYLTKEIKKEEDFVVEDYGREYAIDQGRGMRMVRYSAWRLDRPNVKGYGKTPSDAIYDLTYNVQPL